MLTHCAGELQFISDPGHVRLQAVITPALLTRRIYVTYHPTGTRRLAVTTYIVCVGWTIE